MPVCALRNDARKQTGKEALAGDVVRISAPNEASKDNKTEQVEVKQQNKWKAQKA